jgi:hypothetical protein
MAILKAGLCWAKIINRKFCDTHHSEGAGTVLNCNPELQGLEAPMITFIDRASQAAIGGSVAEYRWRPHGCGELTMLGDYHLPFGKAEARAEATKWLQQAA